DRGALSGFNHRVVDPVPARFVNDLRIVGIENQRTLAFHQLVVWKLRYFFDPRGIVEDIAQVPDASHAGVEPGRRLAGLQARETENPLLGLARVPVVEHFLVRAGGHAGTPAPAAVLVHQYDAVFAALVESPGRARRHAGRIQTVIADARKVEKDQAFHSKQP